MVTSDLGACEWFVWDLRRSGLIDRGQLDQVVGDFLKRTPRAEPPALAEFLVAQSVLSPFQADRILQGKTQGLVLGPYILVDAIGSGSMGQVYKATSKTDNQTYAVKVLPRRSMWNVRLARRQVRSFSQFSHPAIVPFVDVGTSGGQHYLVWPLVEGETLETRVDREGRLSTEQAASILTQIAQGLAIAHQQGLFHGLLKPSNIMLCADGQAKILDFGIGSLLAENEGESLVDTMSTANTLTSGLDCTSPESIMEPTNRTPAGDQYSFGCVLYYALAGRYPHPDGTAVEKMMAHQFKPHTPIREIVANAPDALVAILDRLLQKSPESRYPAVEDLVEAIMPLAGDAVRRNMNFNAGPGSHSGSSRFGSSGFGGSRFATPIPSSHPGVAAANSAHVPTPHSGPLTPVPGSAPSFPASTDSVRGGARSPSVSRGSFSPSADGPRNIPVAKVAANPFAAQEIPVAQAVETPAPRGRKTSGPGSPEWEEPKKAGGISVLMVFLIAGLVTVGVYLLGKNFLFQ